jgi:hypothetical protein
VQVAAARAPLSFSGRHKKAAFVLAVGPVYLSALWVKHVESALWSAFFAVNALE